MIQLLYEIKDSRMIFLRHKIVKTVMLFTLILSFRTIAQTSTDTEPVKEEKSLFQHNAQIAMSSSDYQVTAGDSYVLSFYANNAAVSYTITVDPTYKIRIANLGAINCEGLNFIQLKQNIEALVTRNYPLSVITFVMLQPSVFKVTVTGEVSSVREINAWALSRLSDVLGAAGLTEFSSTRNVRITNSKRQSKTCDLFKASRYGDFSENPYLRPGDVITFSRAERKVSVSGSIERGGTYELLNGENLSELVNKYGGGILQTGDPSRIRLLRVDDSEEKIRKISYLGKDDLDKNFALLDKDSVYIPDWNELQPYIEIKGVIKPPDSDVLTYDAHSANASNVYVTKTQFYASENYASLIRRIKQMFTVFSNLKEAYVQRGNERFIVEADKIIDNPEYESPYFVQKEDSLVIPYKPLFDENSYGLDFSLE